MIAHLLEKGIKIIKTGGQNLKDLLQDMGEKNGKKLKICFSFNSHRVILISEKKFFKKNFLNANSEIRPELVHICSIDL